MDGGRVNGFNRRVRAAATATAMALTASTVGVLAATVLTTAAPSVAHADDSRTYYHQYACEDGVYVVPPLVTSVEVEAVGAAGADGQTVLANAVGAPVAGGPGGLGAKVVTTIPVTPGEQLYVGAASGAFPGGNGGYAGTIDVKVGLALGNGGKGGAASWVSRTSGCVQPSPVVVAAGGGGGGGAGSHFDGTETGGAGGSAGATGGNGQPGASNASHDGAGGSAASNVTTSSSGGAGGHGWMNVGAPLFAAPCITGSAGAGRSTTGGSGGAGGSAAIEMNYKDGCGSGYGAGYEGDNNSGGGGGGGGGWVGGGGGGGADDARAAGGGGGAGSSYVAGGTGTTITTSGAVPSVTIRPVHTAPAITSGASATVHVGSDLRFDVTTTGYPAGTIWADGLPAGFTLTDDHDGTAKVEGHGAPYLVGSWPVTIHAANDTGSTTQSFSLVVDWDAIAVAGISPDQSSARLVAGDPPTQLTADISYANGYLRHVTSEASWSSSVPGVATVSSSGRLTPLHAGQTTITATIDGNSITGDYTVINGSIATFSVTPQNRTLDLGDARQYTATVTYPGGDTQDVTGLVTWSSSDPTVASVSSTGTVTAVGGTEGSTAAIMATITDPEDGRLLSAGPVAQVTVTLAHPMAVTVAPTGITLHPGQSQQLTATGSYAGGKTADVTALATWSSSNPTAATVGSTTGFAQTAVTSPGGRTDISASLGATSGSTSLTVLGGAPQSIEVTPVGATVGLGATRQMTALAHYVDGSQFDVTASVSWTSDDAAVVAVDGSGVATGSGSTEGANTRINATFAYDGGTITGSTPISLTLAHPLSIAVTPIAPTVAPNTSTPFTATGTYPGGRTVDITALSRWTSSNTAVGTIADYQGILHTSGPVGGGSTTVTATSPDGAVSGSTVVTREIGSPTSLDVTPASPSIGLGEQRQMSAIAHYADGSTVDVTTSATWSVVDASVFSITPGGLVTGLSATPGAASSIKASYTSPYGGTVTGATVGSITLAHPASIAVTPGTATMLANSSRTFTAIATYPGGTSLDISGLVTWSLPVTALAHRTTFGTVVTESTSPGGTVVLTATSPDGAVSGSATITSLAALSFSGPSSTSSSPTLSTAVLSPFTSPAFQAAGGSGNYTWTTPNGLPPGLALSATTGASVTLTGTPTTAGTYNLRFDLRDADDPTPSAVITSFLTLDVTKLDQVITSFTGPTAGVTGVSIPMSSYSAVGGGSTSPVTFSAAGAACAISGGNLVLIYGGQTCTLKANQAGDTNHNAAPEVQLTVGIRWSQTITWLQNPGVGAVVGGSSSSSYVYATVDSSGLPVSFTVDPATTNGACSLAGSTYGSQINYLHVGTCVIDADQAGDATNAPAPRSTQTFTIGKGAQSVSFVSSAPAGAKVGGTYTPNLSSTPSGNAVVFSVNPATTNAACSVHGSSVWFDHVGTCAIDAQQPASADYNASSVKTQTFSIAKGNQTISFTNAAPVNPVAFSAGYTPGPIATSGLPVTLTIDPTTTNHACSLFGGTLVSFDHAGTCVVAANQAGNADWNAASVKKQSTTVAKAGQSITLNTPPPPASIGGSWLPDASGGASGNPVTVAIDPATTGAACSTPDGTSVHFDNPGTCVVDLTQAGNGDYLAAPAVPVTVTVHVLHLAVLAPSSITASPDAHAGGLLALVDDTQTAFVPSSDVVVSLSSTSPGAVFSDADGGTPVGSVTIPAGAFLVPFFAGDTVAGTSTITASDPSGLVAPVSFDVPVTPAAASQLAFTTPSADGFSGQALSPVAVQLEDSWGNAVAAAGVVVTLVPDHGSVTGADATTDANGVATFTATTFAAAGTYQLNATSDTGLSTVSPTASFVVHGAPAVTQVLPATGPTTGGQQVNLYGHDLSGTTSVSFGSVPAAGVTVVDDTHVIAVTPAGAVGTVPMTATNPAGTTPAGTFTYSLNRYDWTVLSSSATPVRIGAPVTFTAAVHRYASTGPTGSVMFVVDGALAATVPVNAYAKASFTTTSLTIGDHSVLAVYSGDVEFRASASNSVTQTITTAPTAATIASSPNPSALGQKVTVTGHVNRTYGLPAPTGTFTLMDGPNIVGYAYVGIWGNGQVSTTSLSAGSHDLTMVYSGDAVYAPSTSPVLSQLVQGRTTTVTMAASANPATVGTAVTFTGHVNRIFGAPAPTGTMTLYEGSTAIGTAMVGTWGNAVVRTSSLPVGNHQLTMTYNGDGYYAAVTTAPLTVTIVP